MLVNSIARVKYNALWNRVLFFLQFINKQFINKL